MLLNLIASLRLRNSERLQLMLLDYNDVHAILPVTINGKFCNFIDVRCLSKMTGINLLQKPVAMQVL